MAEAIVGAAGLILAFVAGFVGMRVGRGWGRREGRDGAIAELRDASSRQDRARADAIRRAADGVPVGGLRSSDRDKRGFRD